MQRMHGPPFDGPARCGQRLTEHLPAEDLPGPEVGTLAPEDVLLDGFEIEQQGEVVEAVGHARIVPGLC